MTYQFVIDNKQLAKVNNLQPALAPACLYLTE
jgi:hypothetical protein